MRSRFDKGVFELSPDFRSSAQVRQTLQTLLDEHGHSRAHASRVIGRNRSYLGKFMAGKSAALPRDDARLLSRYFGVDERELGVLPSDNDNFVVEASQ